MKNLNLVSLSMVTMLSLVGCGSSSSSETGTGYYVDSAVVGVTYVCGSKRGKTAKDGRFIFEKGKGCTFSLAGVVPFTPAVNGTKLREFMLKTHDYKVYP